MPRETGSPQEQGKEGTVENNYDAYAKEAIELASEFESKKEEVKKVLDKFRGADARKDIDSPDRIKADEDLDKSFARRRELYAELKLVAHQGEAKGLVERHSQKEDGLQVLHDSQERDQMIADMEKKGYKWFFREEVGGDGLVSDYNEYFLKPREETGRGA